MAGDVRVRVTLLGPFEVSRGGRVLPVPGARLRGLLVRLALAGGRAVDPETLVHAVWAGEPPSGPAAALHTLVSRLRRALAPTGVEQVPGGYRLAVDPADVDALRFEQLARDGRDGLRAGDPEAAARAAGQALALWPDRPGAEPPAVAVVAPAVATRLARLSIGTVTDLAAAELALGRAEVAADRLTALPAEEQAHEGTAAVLMDALAAAGRQAEALAVYERVRVTLAEVLGADPGAALRERHLRLLRPGPAPAAPAGNLPAPLTGLIGRDDELARIAARLRAGRLVTVTGPGGAGKTRLALEAARRHAGRDGAWLVDLAPVTEPAKIASAVLAGIGLRGNAVLDARRRAGGDDARVLAGELGGRDSLLLVDNCEHLIDAVAHLIADLLSRCPRLRVLATSREPLTIGGEVLVPLGPLPRPEPDDDVDTAGRSAAVRLFVERAAAVRPGFALDAATLPPVRTIVRSLDGLPLALELAAARLRTLSPAALADGLCDRFGLLTAGSRTAPPRHRTLRAVIAWSWDLLNERERTMAERISVLPGGVTVSSAAAVCAGTSVPAAAIPGLLAQLIDRSLLHLAPRAGRYRMLETIREYGVDRLTGRGELGPARDRAAAHVTALVARQDPRLRGPHQRAAMIAIEAEYDNALAALRHLCTTHDSRGATALALALTWYWQMSGRQSDAAYWLGEVLAVPGDEPGPGHDCARAALLLSRADIAPGTPAAADRTEMRALAGRLLRHPGLPGHHRVFGPILLFLLEPAAARESFRRLAGDTDAWLSGLSHMFLAEIAENAGEPERTRAHVEASLDRFRQAGDRWGRTAGLPMRAQLRRYDDLDGALADLHEARALAAEFGPPGHDDQLHSDLRWIDVYVRRGDTGRALAMLEAARQRARQASSAASLLLIDTCEAALRVRAGELVRASELLGRAGAAHPERAALLLASDDLPGAAETLRAAYAAALTTRELPILAQVTVHTAALAERQDGPRRTAVLLGVAARLRGLHDHTDPRIRELTERGRAALGDDGFAAAYAQGWELDQTTAVTAADPAPSAPLGRERRPRR